MTNTVKTVYLLDGSSYIHRAYHAITTLSNSRGLRTNAIFGFTKMLLKLFEEKNPEYLAVVLDTKEPTFRHKIYKDYKATRPPMPEELVEQLPYINKIVQGLSVKIFEKPGYEADDIIGTLARVAEEKDYSVVIVTGDKDFRQVVSHKTSLWDTMKNKYTDYDTLIREYGIEPSQMVDLMGLAGDSSDNIPGVPGVGEKTAVALIKDFGTLENVYQNLDEINKKKLKENLQKSYQDAALSKKLVTIERHVPLDEDIDSLKVGTPRRDELSKIFRELEFKGLWERFAQRQDDIEEEYRLCISKEDVLELVDMIKSKGMVSMDTETTSLDPHQAELVGISFSLREGQAFYIPMGHVYLGAPQQLNVDVVLEILKSVLEDDRIAKVGQNIKYDALVLKHHGIDLNGIYFDTMIASYVINPGLRQHNLDYLAGHYLNHKMISYHDVVRKGKDEENFSGVDVDLARVYSCEDADITLRLMSILDQKLEQDMNKDLFYNLEMKLLPVLKEMELAGIKINVPFFKEMSEHFAEKINETQKKIFEEAGMEFNINSPRQLGFVLFEKLRLPGQRKTSRTKSLSTDVKVLNKLALSDFAIPKLILKYRTLSKLKSTYLDALIKMINPSTGRIHTSFNQTVTATGRLSSSNPNLQNIPIRGEEGREIRKGFVAESGHLFVSADYSQVELRIFAHYSGDKTLIEAFRQEEDIHSRTASELLGVPMEDITSDMRRIAKAINFGIIYGMGYRKLSDELGIDTSTAKEYIDSYYKRYEGVARYREEMTKIALEKGYTTTLFNRMRYLPDIKSENNRLRSEAERVAVNTPIQGTAADLIKKAMINIHLRMQKEGFRSKMILQVHDELLFEVPEDEVDIITPVIKKEMEEVHELEVPLKVDIHSGRNWDEAH
jgi:DNA polymerase-1